MNRVFRHLGKKIHRPQLERLISSTEDSNGRSDPDIDQQPKEIAKRRAKIYGSGLVETSGSPDRESR